MRSATVDTWIIAVLSAMLGLGGAIGLVATGTLLRGGVGYHRIFWVHAALVLIVLVVAAVTVPRREHRTAAHVDWVGAAGLALGLSGELLAISKGAAWGCTSPPRPWWARCSLPSAAAIRWRPASRWCSSPE
ncbi:MAG: hypothetical protein FGM50_03065 [Mycobacterium sp.]|nr:hypothetical protein [Mycobacterium sp.]